MIPQEITVNNDVSHKAYKKKSQLAEVWKRYKKNKLAVIGMIILSLLVIVSISADIICDYDTQVIEQNYKERLQTPSINHIFGTDAYGRDVFFRIVHGSRLSLSLGIIVIFAAVLIGAILGSIAGYYGGLIDNIIMRINDVFMATPPLILAIAVVAVLGPTFMNLAIALIISYFPYFARVVRAPLLQIRDKEFIEAARAAGTSNFRIITKHILPNIAAPITVQVSLNIADCIKNAAGLSFIGLGVQPPAPEWGTMLSEGQEFIRNYPYLVIFPGIFIAITLLAFNLIGDGLQDALDPKLKN